MSAELILDARNGVGESPVWVGAQQALWWVDIPARRLWRWDAATGGTRSWSTQELPACIAPRTGGGFLCGMESGWFHVHPHDDGTVRSTLLAAFEQPLPGMRFNDGRCDRQGRFRAGTMLMDMGAGRDVGALWALDEQAQPKVLVDGLIVSNGLAFSPDGRTMYLSDSHPKVQAVWAFDYDIATGTPSRRRLFVDMNRHPGRPDGAAVDEDGCYWICGNDAGMVHRFTPDGRLDRSLSLPVKKPAMCAFGGGGLDTLYVTSIRPDGVDLSDQPLAGGLFALRPGVRGLPEPACIH
jgi:sugar lactone lactonase YvrE